MTHTTTATASHRPSRRRRSRAAAPVQVHATASQRSGATFQSRALLEPATSATEPTTPEAMGHTSPSTTEPTAEEQALAAELMHELGMEPAPCTPEAHALL